VKRRNVQGGWRIPQLGNAGAEDYTMCTTLYLEIVTDDN
jgi:hypothetical protein